MLFFPLGQIIHIYTPVTKLSFADFVTQPSSGTFLTGLVVALG